MRIEQLEYLAAVVQHGSLRRASDRLHLSQPALGEAVTKLERELRVTLLDRRRSGAQISREGRELLPYMEDVLAAVGRLRAAAGDRRGEARPVRLGSATAATASFLVPAVRALQARHPGAGVEVLALRPAQIDEALAEGSLDLGLVDVLGDDDPPPGLVGTALLHGHLAAVLPAGHPLALQQQVTVDDLRRRPFVTTGGGQLAHHDLRRLFGADLPQLRHSADSPEQARALVAEGLGVTALPDFGVTGDPLSKAGRIVARPIASDPVPATIVVRRRASGPASLPARELHAVLVARAAEYRAAAQAS